jgi:hypothetical protein
MSETRFDFLRSSGKFAFLLDGFDELRLPDFELERARTFFEIKDFIGDRSCIVLSCRPTYFATETELKNTLRSLNEPRKLLLRRLYRSEPVRTRVNTVLESLESRSSPNLTVDDITTYTLKEFDVDKIKEYIFKFTTRTDCSMHYGVDALYEYLVGVYDISDLIRRPLLLYIILKMIEAGVIDPARPQPLGGAAEIYSLYIEHCLDREYKKNSGREVFSTNERKVLCQYLALLMFRTKTLRATWNEMIHFIVREAVLDDVLADRIANLGIQEMSSDIRVCSFLKLGEGDTLRFAHKSFMEFFVAQYIYERRQKLITMTPLLYPLSREIIYFIAEFVKISRSFGERICKDRIMRIVSTPAGLDDTQFRALRRNLFAINLAANFQDSIVMAKLAIEWMTFSGTKMSLLSLSQSRMLEVTMKRFDVSSASFRDCNLENVEFEEWETKKLAISGELRSLRVLKSAATDAIFDARGGVINVHESQFVTLQVEGSSHSRIHLRNCVIDAVKIKSAEELVEFVDCKVNSICWTGSSDTETLIRVAPHLSFRRCGGELSGLLFGKLDSDMLNYVRARPNVERTGLFFLDTDIWDKEFEKESDGVAVVHDRLFLKASSAAEIARSSKGNGAHILARLRAAVERISKARIAIELEQQDSEPERVDETAKPIKDLVFFSYSRANDRIALAIVNQLRKMGVKIWIDHSDIPLGQRWDREVEAALSSCAAVLVLLTTDTASSENVLDEIDYAMDRAKPIVPLLLEQCDIPLRLGRLQYVDFTNDYQLGLDQCWGFICKFLSLPCDQHSRRKPGSAKFVNPALSMTVKSLNLSARTLECLRIGGISFVTDLVVQREGALLRIRNFGRNELNETRTSLARWGLRLRRPGKR